MSCVEASGKDLTKGTSPSGDKVYSRCTLQSKVIVSILRLLDFYCLGIEGLLDLQGLHGCQ